MSATEVEHAAFNLDAKVAGWKQLVGTVFGPDGSGLDAPVFYQCCDLYGVGHCGDELSHASKAMIKEWKERLVCATKLEWEKIDGVKQVPLITIRVPGGPAAHDDPAGGAHERADG